MRTKKVKLLVTAVILSLLLMVTGQALASEPPVPVTVEWTGNGTDDGFCSNLGFYSDLSPSEGEQGWLFILTNPIGDSSTLTYEFSDGTSGSVAASKTVGSHHYVVYTDAGAQLLSAYAEYGEAGSVLTVSHCERVPDPLLITKTANPSYTRTWDWDITKAYDHDYVGFTGDSWDHTYKVEVTPDYVDSGWQVSGVITIENPNSWGGTIYISDDTSVADETCEVENDGVVEMGANDTEYVNYTCTFSSMPVGEKVNTATVDWDIYTYTGTANFTFGDPTSEIHPVISVEDSMYPGLEGQADRDGAYWEYTRTFTCSGDEGSYENTATIFYEDTQTYGDSASATVTVDCYDLDVNKTADTSFTRTYEWSIDKSADYSALTLATGQVFTVTYDVTLDAYYIDSDWAVSGAITVYNPAPIAATINSVSDYVSGDPSIPAEVTCGVDFPYELAAGETLECTYNADLPNANGRTNSAKATLQNTPSGTTDFSGYADVSFTEASIEHVDECVNVADSFAGSTVTGTVCYEDTPKTFTYARDIGPYEVCGEFSVYNLATALTNDTETLISDSWTVDVTVPCPGCTLTQGYWKTHSKYGPAPYDDNWADMEDDSFFLSGKTYYEVFWTPPAGNAYYNLAHQYIAAILNVQNGASSTPAVDGAIAWAENFFNTYNPIAKVSKSNKAAVTYYAGILGSYNEGSIGPGHCDE